MSGTGTIANQSAPSCTEYPIVSIFLRHDHNSLHGIRNGILLRNGTELKMAKPSKHKILSGKPKWINLGTSVLSLLKQSNETEQYIIAICCFAIENERVIRVGETT